MLDFYRQFPHANAGGMMDRRRDRGSYAREPDLADAACPEFVNLFVGEIKEVHLDRRRASIGGASALTAPRSAARRR